MTLQELRSADLACPPDISVIIPVTEAHDDAAEIWRQYSAAVASTGHTSEFIYVLDGPHDLYARRLLEVTAGVRGVKLASFRHPFGVAACIQEGARLSSGRSLLLLPDHLQVTPESIPRLIEESTSVDVLAAERDRRGDNVLRRWRASLFTVLARLAGSRYADPGCIVHMVKRRVLEELHLQQDQQFFLPLLAERLGFSVRQIRLPQAESDRRFRRHRLSRYAHRLLDILALAFLVRFLHRPFRFFGAIGAALLAGGLLLGIVLVLQRTIGSVPLAGRPALLLMVLLIVLGIQVGIVGLIAEILIFTRSRGIPTYRIDRIVVHREDEG
jgi:Glycosyl transferase family 2